MEESISNGVRTTGWYGSEGMNLYGLVTCSRQNAYLRGESGTLYTFVESQGVGYTRVSCDCIV